MHLLTSICLVIIFNLLSISHAQDLPPTKLLFADGSLEATAQWEKGPLKNDESILMIQWRESRSSTPTNPPGEVKVRLWMPDMGHGSSPTHIEQVLDENKLPIIGFYRVNDIYFTMSGRWEVHVILTHENGVKESQSFEVLLKGKHRH